ncbi:MAG: phosphoribosylanthranilate isomerase [Candidatus Dormibacteraeota bacterium]|nr:phosphoribosylanthranilate isomerase [Candidatus Dormibacteraeota bacterium]
MTRIKICGNTNPRDVELAAELGVDLLGFIFTSSRRRISVEDGRALMASVPPSVEKVGVFIDESASEIGRAVAACGLTGIQVYRPLSDDDRSLGVKLFPAVRVRNGDSLRDLQFEEGDHPLLDTWAGEAAGGGTGRSWLWADAIPLAKRYPIAVSGGLNPGNVGDAIAEVKPWGVDVCSGVESEPGRKDPAKLRAFVTAVRQAAER